MEADVFSRMQIKFWGVRGSIPTPQLDYLGYGGNTTCIEIRLEDRIIIIDGGSGVRPFGNSLIGELKLYMVHGLLHLHGFDDQTPGQARKMRTVQEDILRVCGRDR